MPPPPLELEDLSPYSPLDADEDAWLSRLAAHLRASDYVLSLTGRRRDDDEDDPALTRLSDGRWSTGRFIGEISFEGREIKIVPRLGIDVVGLWLARAMNLTILPKSATEGAKGPLIAQLIDRIWSAGLAEAARHGPPRFRHPHRHQGVFLRGRLDVPATLRLRTAASPKLASRLEPRSLANPVSRAIVLADRTLSSILGSDKPWRPQQSSDLLGQLTAVVGVNPRLPSERALRGVRYTPITRRFERISALSMEIAKRRGTLASGAGDDSNGILVDVAELWELFLLHCARRAFGDSHVEHGTAVSSTAFLMASTVDETKRIGRLKPDLLIRGHGGEMAVIDAKYKRLRNGPERPAGVDRGDLYQLAAYLSGHSVPIGALAYPPDPRDNAVAEAYGPWRLQSQQEARFVRMPADEVSCVAALRQLVATRAPV